MKEKLKRIHDKMGNLLSDMRALMDKADEEKRDLSTEEDGKYARMEADYDKLEKDAERLDRAIKRDERANKSLNKPPLDDLDDGQRSGKNKEAEEKRAKAFVSFLRGGLNRVTPDEIRALQADADISGGFVVAPEQFVAELIKAVDNAVFIREFANVIPVLKAASLGAPSLDADPADPTWTGEVGAAGEDSTMSFGKRELNPHPLAKLIKVSEKLLRVSAMDIDALVRNRLAYKFGVTEENAYLNGTGSNQPLGMFVASDDGIPTGRDVSTGNTTTLIKPDGLIEALYSLKEGYIRNARWIFHRTAIKQIRKLKDGEGQYIWQPGLAADKQNSILDRPYHMSEYAPSTFTTGQYVGLVGDLSFYWIADALDMRVQRLDELYAVNNQVGFIGRKEGDGMPVLGEAFARVKLA